MGHVWGHKHCCSVAAGHIFKEKVCVLRGRLELGADLHLNPHSLDDLGDSVGLTKILCFHFFQCS